MNFSLSQEPQTQGILKLNINRDSETSPISSTQKINKQESDCSSEEFEPQSYDGSSQRIKKVQNPSPSLHSDPLEIPPDAELLKISTSHKLIRKDCEIDDDDNLNLKKKHDKSQDYEYDISPEEKELFDLLKITKYIRKPKYVDVMNDAYANEIITKAAKELGLEDSVFPK